MYILAAYHENLEKSDVAHYLTYSKISYPPAPGSRSSRTHGKTGAILQEPLEGVLAHRRMKTVMRTTATLIVSLALMLAATAAQAGSVTSNKYWANSVSQDIADSCKEVSINSSTGVLSAKCNQQQAGGDYINLKDTSLDLDTVMYCKCSNNVVNQATIVWGSSSTNTCAPYNWYTTGWKVNTSSNGNDYTVEVKCKYYSLESTHWRDVGDTTNGLKNSTGDLEKR